MPTEFKSNIRVIDIWDHIEPRFGGVGPAASSLSTAVALQSNMPANQIAVCDYSEENYADGIDPRARKIFRSPIRGWADFSLSKALSGAIAEADVCHVHSLWKPHCLAARRIAAQTGKPIVSSVHGNLEHWDLNNKRLKKSVYSWLFERTSLAQSQCLRALSDREIVDYIRFGVRKPIALIPNGIHPMKRVDTAVFFGQFPELTGKTIVLFLGRIHRKKGVLNLVRAWKSVAERHDAAHLVIAGPDYAGTASEVRRLTDELEIQKSVTTMDVITGDTKLSALSAAKFFCLPSYSEGLSVAVLEALSIGLPAIVTPECNIPAVAATGSGVSTSNEPSALADTLISCLSLGASKWQEMSQAAHELARSQFDWTSIAATMQSVYEWLLGGDKPACIVEPGK